jgi:hypothetical protein
VSRTVELDKKIESPAPNNRRLQVTIYQIAADEMLEHNRADGSGWDWGCADWQRDWMDASPSRFAYHCLPLTIANQTGLWIKNPVGLTATWRGEERPGSIDFEFDRSEEAWKTWISNEFGLGIITWNTPFLFRTKPDGSRLLVCGPANYFKANAHPLITASNNSANKKTLPELWDDIVQIPEYLNGSVLHNGFLWFGPAGTITAFHHDLTNNLMAQVMGRKRILLTPSWDMPLMRNLFHVYCEIDGRATPPAPRARFGQPQILECILNPGEILFLPVGCLHFVQALEISATMSFTNFGFDDNDYTSFYHAYHNV